MIFTSLYFASLYFLGDFQYKLYKFQSVVQQIMSSLINITQSYMILTICTKPYSVHSYLQLAKTTLMTISEAGNTLSEQFSK